MSFKTQHYNLDAFTWGDVYSSRVDQRRMSIIDNQLEFLSEMIGSGVILGWDISDNEDGTVTVAPGMGIINKRVLQSFGGNQVSLSNNASHYLYMRAKEGDIAGTSGNSNIGSAIGVDDIAPYSPSSLKKESSVLTYLASLNSYNSDLLAYFRRLLGRKEEDDSIELLGYKEVAFSWNANTDADLSHYKIIRIDGTNIDVLGITTEIVYADTNLTQERTYTYQVIAVDVSGNESNATEIDIATDKDERIPLPPSFIQVFPSDGTMEVIWNHSASDNVPTYRIVIQELDGDYNNVGTSVAADVDASADERFGSTYTIFEGIKNNTNYNVTVYSVSEAEIVSDGITERTFLKALDGAGEISNIEVDYVDSVYENVGLETTLTWRYGQSNPSLSNASKFLITFIENGSRASEVIEITESAANGNCSSPDDANGVCYSHTIKYIPFGTDTRYESIKEYTPYFIVIKTVDENGNISNGVVIRTLSEISDPVPAITDFSMERKSDNRIFLSWSNPTKFYFSHNLITIRILDLTTDALIGTPYVENLRIDKSETFVIPSDSFSVDYRYDVEIDSYDVFNDSGEGFEATQQFTAATNRLKPSTPSGIELQAGDTKLFMRWNLNSENEEVEFYKIYRADFSYYLRSSSFSLINTIPSSSNEFIDYTVTNGTSYAYIITAVDVYGTESLSPSDNHMSSGVVTGTPSKSVSFSPPTGLLANANSNESDVDLVWDVTSGSFEGYEILRSDGNNYSFNTIAFVPVSQTYYSDTDALLKDGETYYYIVRKYKNGTSLTVSSSSALPSNSIFIGSITTTDGISVLTIDVSSVVNLENFEDPLTTKTNAALDIHHHIINGSIDKRIELRSNVHISDWTTNDYQTYATEQDTEGATSYILRISGTINESYFTDTEGNTDVVSLRQAQAGESPVLYEIDSSNDKVIFNHSLFSSEGSFSAPYSEAPSLSLELLGISEVNNLLSNDKIESISATQFDSGRFSSTQMPEVDHEGRRAERLLPLLLPLQTIDNFVYSMAATYEDSDRNMMGDAVTFYDVIQVDSDRLLAATSSGIWLSDNYGSDWQTISNLSVAVHKLYKSNAGDYYAITNYGVYKNDGSSFRSWVIMSGLDYVKAIRDITEDSSANLYISTDLGVFRLNSVSIPYIEDTWEKLPIFGPRSSEAYALLYDSEYFDSAADGRLLVSNELGLLQSTDEGRSWNYVSDLESSVKIRNFVIDEGYIFALSDTSVYREEIGMNTFEEIASIDASSSRGMVIRAGEIYISTDDGPKVSNSDNIYGDEDIEFISVWPSVNIKNNAVVVSSIDKIGDDIFIGTDRRLFLCLINGNVGIQYEQFNTVVPTFYVNSEVKKIGFYYNNRSSAHNVSFDEIIDIDTTISVANKYDIYNAKYGGWGHNKYDAQFIVYDNNSEFGRSQDIIDINMDPFVNVSLPVYDDNNAHKAGADIYKTQLEIDLAQLTSLESPTGEALVELVSDVYLKFELFLSQLHKEVKSDFVLPTMITDLIKKRSSVSNEGVVTEIEEPAYAEINAERGTDYTASVNIVNGLFVFGLAFDRYDELTIDIYDVTVKNIGDNSHREIEDIFEMAYSGPPSYLSQVQQVNLVKIGIFTEQSWSGEREELATPLQLKSILPTADSGYDTLNSTINYTKEIIYEDTNLSISYPSTVAYVASSGSILVGGFEGVISIDKDTLEITEVEFGSIPNQMVRAIIEANSNIYILTDEDIFVSSDDGASWEEYNRNGLPNQLYSMGSISNNLIIGASDGLYIKLSDSDTVDWEKVMDSTSPIMVMHSSNILFVVADRKIYTSSNGFVYTDTGVDVSLLDITGIDRYGYTNTYLSTNQGLYSDNGTFNSLNVSLEEIVLDDLFSSEETMTINDVTTNSSDMTVVAVSNGTYGVIQDDMLKIREFTALGSIHKVIIIDSDIWLFGRDAFKVPYLDYPVKLSTGTPM